MTYALCYECDTIILKQPEALDMRTGKYYCPKHLPELAVKAELPGDGVYAT